MMKPNQAKDGFSNISRQINKLSCTASLWPKPTTLPESEIKASVLDAELIPEGVRSWVLGIADRMQVTPEFVMAPLLVGSSSLIGRKIGVFPKAKDSWLVAPNLWGAVVARPGYFKSPILAEVFRGITELANQAAKRHVSEMKANDVKAEILKVRIDGLKDGIKKAARNEDEEKIEGLQKSLEALKEEASESTPLAKRYFTNDTTVEKMALILNENPRGVLLLRDELYGWLRMLGKHGREGDREFYLEAWNGYGAYSIDRIGRGTIHIPALCLSIFGGLQPGKLDQYVSGVLQGGEEDDGLLQRFQVIVFPEMPRKWRNVDSRAAPEVEKKIFDMYKWLDDVSVDSLSPVQRGEKVGIEFSVGGQEVFNAWRCQLENRLRSGTIQCPGFESHLAKYRSLMPSLALLLHLIDLSFVSSVSSPLLTQISEFHAEKAVAWCEFLESHARKVYRLALAPELSAAKTLLQKIRLGRVAGGDSVRSIYRNQWSELDSKKRVNGALATLEKYGWIRIEEKETAGRVTEVIRLNPHF